MRELFEMLTPSKDKESVLDIIPVHLREQAFALYFRAQQAEIVAEYQKEDYAILELSAWVLGLAQNGEIPVRHSDAVQLRRIAKRHYDHIRIGHPELESLANSIGISN